MGIKEFVKKNWLILSLILIALMLHIIYALIPTRFWWDESIYVGLAKSLFSGGALGFWETFRPLGLPLVLGASWKLGINPVIMGKSLAVAAYMAVLVLVYLIAEKCRKGSGVYSFLLAASFPLLFRFSNIIVTDLLSMALGLLAMYLVFREKYFWAGLTAALAFVFRFPYGLIIVCIYFFMLLKLFEQGTETDKKTKGDKSAKAGRSAKTNKKSIWHSKEFRARLSKVFIKSIIVLLGILLIIVPYLSYNYVRYGDVMTPFVDANKLMTQEGVFIYNEKPTYYLSVLLNENFSLIIAGLFLLFYLMDKTLRKNAVLNTLLFSAVISFAYFTYLVHKEVRYIILLLPIIAIFGGILLDRLVIFSRKRFGTEKSVIARNILISLGLLFVLFIFYIHVRNVAMYTEAESKFYNYFDKDTQGTLLATNPTYMMFTDKPVMFLASWDYAQGVYDQYKGWTDYIAINSCDYLCDPKSDCESKRQAFYENVLNKFPVVFNDTGIDCVFTIYKVEYDG